MNHMAAPSVMSSGQIVPKLITAYKYILTDSGVTFVLGAPPASNPRKSARMTLAKGRNGMVFLRFGDIYALLTERIIDHLKKVMEMTPHVEITFAQSLPDDYEITPSHTSEIDRVNCATLISLYRLVNDKALRET